ncbi:MAG: MmcQ/YjbR family DNA-binding protein [Chitinophagales bacterium]
MDIEEIRTFCLNLPDVQEDVKWGHDLCFLIGGKMFCVTGFSADSGVSLKVRDEEFEELSSSEGIIPAPYLARHKWIYIKPRSRFKRKEWEHYISQSYELIKSKLPAKVRQGIGSSSAKKAKAKKK